MEEEPQSSIPQVLPGMSGAETRDGVTESFLKENVLCLPLTCFLFLFHPHFP